MAVLDEIKHPWIHGWIAHGESLGEAKGEARGEAKAILLFLEGRGLDLADEARERILGCTDQQVLESWIHKAVTIECVDELFD